MGGSDQCLLGDQVRTLVHYQIKAWYWIQRLPTRQNESRKIFQLMDFEKFKNCFDCRLEQRKWACEGERREALAYLRTCTWRVLEFSRSWLSLKFYKCGVTMTNDLTRFQKAFTYDWSDTVQWSAVGQWYFCLNCLGKSLSLPCTRVTVRVRVLGKLLILSGSLFLKFI